MPEDKTQENKKNKISPSKVDIKNMGINIDKNEYQEIVLSNSNFPDRTYFEKEYID